MTAPVTCLPPELWELSSLRSLTLWQLDIDDSAAIAIAVQLPQLTTLNLPINDVVDTAVKSIANCLGQLRSLEHFTQELPHIGDAVPKKWVSIRESLEELAQSRPYIPQDEYFALYELHLELDRVKALHLSRYLHDLGVCLHFQQSRELRRTVFLQNQWVTDAVFRMTKTSKRSAAGSRCRTATGCGPTTATKTWNWNCGL